MEILLLPSFTYSNLSTIQSELVTSQARQAHNKLSLRDESSET